MLNSGILQPTANLANLSPGMGTIVQKAQYRTYVQYCAQRVSETLPQPARAPPLGALSGMGTHKAKRGEPEGSPRKPTIEHKEEQI